jgi:hypothetical protein
MMDHSSRFMAVTLRTGVCMAAIVCFAGAAPAIAKKARVVCEYGRCWQTDAGWGYPYGYRPPTKWNRRAFVLPVRLRRATAKREQTVSALTTSARARGSLAIFTAIRRASSLV